MKVAIIAGSGLLPVLAAKSIKDKGDELVVITFTEQMGLDFTEYSNNIVTFGMGQVGKILKFLKKSNIESLVFAGKINKEILEQNLKLDLKALWMLARLKDRQENTIMLAIASEIEKLGIKILSQLDVLPHLVVKKGIHSKRKPDKKQLKDVKFAYEKARGLAGLDIGQSIVVKNKTVLAIESLEGTNRTIERGAEFCNGGFTFMKVAKPNQDYRFDLPVIGMETLKAFVENGGGVFAVEADFALAINIDECIKFADDNNIVFMAYSA